MKKKSLILLLLLFILTLPTIAGAEKNKWKSSDYNFSTVRTVIMTDIESNSPDIKNYIAAPFSEKLVETALKQAFAKRQIEMFTATDTVSDNSLLPPFNLTIKPIIHALGKWSERKKAYYETRTVYKKIIVKDRHGRDTIIEVPTDESIYHPARTVWHAVTNLEFIVSSENGEKVYMTFDERERPEEVDTSGMLGRICNDVANDLSHN